MKIAMAQLKLSLGDFKKNSQKILEAVQKARGRADLILFPEGGLWGYPPKDYLYQDKYFQTQESLFKAIRKNLGQGLGALLPAFIKSRPGLYNGAFLFEKNKKPRFFAKEFLPDQTVFFESRYFKKGKTLDNFFYWKGKKIHILICEDLWRIPKAPPADLLIALNASPYTDQKPARRREKIKKLARELKGPALYLNLIGAQDSLIFDGGSFAANRAGDLLWQGAFFKPDFKIINPFQAKPLSKAKQKKSFLPLQEQRKQALILGIKDFFSQTGFKKALIGLSGGIDSAVCAYLAAEAVGKKNTAAFFLSGPYSSSLSLQLARETAKSLGIPLKEKSIKPLLKTFLEGFQPRPKEGSIVLQNVQARLRTLLLMAEANKAGSLLLAASNKSELAMGYSTLYGDLAGALCPIGDLLKTELYDLARHINKKESVFSKELLSREPSAELAPRQKDSRELPPYNKLDPILKKFLANKKITSAKEKKLLEKMQKQEFKRAQAPPILKVSDYDLGESWKRPIAHNFPV